MRVSGWRRRWGPPPDPVTPVSTGTSYWPTCHWTTRCSSPTRRSTTRSTPSSSTAMENASSTRRSATISRPWPRSSNRTLERSSWPISVVRDEWMLGAYVEGIAPVDRFELCRRRGGRYALATSLDDFAYLPPDWGYPGEVVRAAMERFNESARAGRLLEPESPVQSVATRPAAVLRRRGGRGHHLHVRRCAHRRPRSSARRAAGDRSQGCSRPAPTRAACTCAPTPAVSPLPPCSACVPRRPHSAATDDGSHPECSGARAVGEHACRHDRVHPTP